MTAPSSTRRDDLMAAVTLAPGRRGRGGRHVLRSVLAEPDLTPALAGYGDLAALRKPPDALARHLP